MMLSDKMQKDPLTLCYRKEFLIPYLEELRVEYAAYRKPFSVLLIDVDGFKSFNDKHGHLSGDAALEYFASSLRLHLEGDDFAIFRFGGDEFIVIFPGRTSKESFRLAESIENNIRNRPFLFRGHEYKITFSGGVTACPEDSLDIKEIIEKADKAMYFSKRRDPGRVMQYSRIRLQFILRLISYILWVLLIVIAIMTVSNVFYGKIQGMHNNFSSLWVKNSTPGKPHIARVYLMSGHLIEGIITGESANDITLKFNMATGEGFSVIRKSNIKYIDRD